MKLQTRLAVLVCKASGAVLRRLGRGGTNLPGKLALKIDKNILGELSRGVKVTVVTGTNGKTTSSRMIEQAFADAGLKYFSNKSGANLLTGIIAVFAQHSTLSGKCPYTHALIECDEAAFRKTSEYLPVECLVVNNIFRDQLDRYGEITHTLNAIRAGGGRLICVGTTSVRTIETVATEDGIVHPGAGDTAIFIYPGKKIKAVDALITNFHLPQSTLLMLVSTFMGRETALDVYREAVQKKYRFFSFGDAMFIE